MAPQAGPHPEIGGQTFHGRRQVPRQPPGGWKAGPATSKGVLAADLASSRGKRTGRNSSQSNPENQLKRFSYTQEQGFVDASGRKKTCQDN